MNKATLENGFKCQPNTNQECWIAFSLSKHILVPVEQSADSESWPQNEYGNATHILWQEWGKSVTNFLILRQFQEFQVMQIHK